MSQPSATYKKTLVLSLLILPAILNSYFSLGAFGKLSIKNTFHDIVSSNWLGDGVLLGDSISNYLRDYQPVILVYPKGHDAIEISKRPFRYVAFDVKTYPYLYPGRIEERLYEYNLQPRRYNELLALKHTWIKGRYQKFCLVYPTVNSSKKEFIVYKRGKISLVVSKGL